MPPARRRPRRRRAKGTGSVYVDGLGWRAVIKVPSDDDPSRLVRRSRRGDDPDELEEWLDELVRQYALVPGYSSPVRRDRIPSLTAFAQEWINRREDAVARSTTEGYRNTVANYIVPSGIGSIRLDRLTRADLRSFTAYLRSCEPALTFESQHWHWRNLRAILNAAKREEYIDRLMIHAEDGPQRPRTLVAVTKRERAIDAEQVGRLLAVLESERWECSLTNHSEGRCRVEWWLAITLGIRQGERLAIQRQDVELHDEPRAYGILTLRRHAERVPGKHGCKGAKDGKPSCGKRFGRHCPQGKPPRMELLPGLKSRQGERGVRRLYLDEHLAGLMTEHLNALWGTQPDTLVFGHKGDAKTIKQPEQDTRVFRALQAEARVSRSNGTPFAVHDLRHTAATLLLNETGGNITVTKAILGHGDIRTTLGYVHQDAEDTAEGVTSLTSYLRAAGTLGVINLERRESYQAEYEALMAKAGGDLARFSELLYRKFAIKRLGR